MKEVFVGRLEALEEAGRRRDWPGEVKARIVLESLAPGARIVDVARRHRLLPSQLTTWRRLARQGRLALPAKGDGSAETPSFAPLEIEGPRGAPAAPIREPEGMEIVVGGVAIRLPGATPAARLVERAWWRWCRGCGAGRHDRARTAHGDRDRAAPGGFPAGA